MQRWLPIVLWLAFGCSGTPDDSTGGGGGGGGTGGASAGTAGAGGLAGSAGQTPGGAGAATSGAGPTGGNGGSAPLTTSLLFPLALGNKWTFSGAPTNTCMTAGFEESITSYELHAGRMAYQSLDTCRPDSPVWLSEQDGAIAQSSGTAWALTLAPPIEEGAEWDSAGVRFAWHAVPSVTVPAGTFKDCWKRSLSQHPEAFARTYCPGVGPTLDEYHGVRTELTAFVLAP